jgi:sigma-B regulation protein RsbU (phosphoserine phosphatase)
MFARTHAAQVLGKSRRRLGQGYMGLLKNKEQAAFDQTDKKMVEHELSIAADIQENLMPKKIPQIPGFEVTAYYKPCQDVGGDYYDFLELDKDHIGFLVADVAGKGVPGALVMVATRAYIRSEAANSLSAKDVAIRINQLLYEDIPRGMFVTMFYCTLDTRKGILTCLSAGHNPMVLWRHATNSVHIVNPNGIALGIDRGPVFERTVKEQQVQLMPGDRFVIYTDGLVEAMNGEKQMYGAQRFYRKCKETASRESSEFLSLVVKNVEEHVGTASPHDDITIVTCRSMYSQDTPYPVVA